MAKDTSCLYSTVKNTCGSRRTFSFLPPFGRDMDDGEELTIFGSILEALNRGGGYQAGQVNRDAFVRAVEAGDLQIVSTPSPIYFDTGATPDASKMLQVSNSIISAVPPCFENNVT